MIQKLNYEKIHICGHDIGAHVAFSFAANYPGATSKLIILDTSHPDESMYQLPMLPILGLNYPYPWWLAFNQVKELPEVLLTGRMNLVIDWVFNALLNNPGSINEFNKAVYSGFSKKFATNIGKEKIEDSGHFLLAEKPWEVAKLIIAFLE